MAGPREINTPPSHESGEPLPRCGVTLLQRGNPPMVLAMNRSMTQRLLWSALATAVAPYAFYLLAARQLRPAPLDVSFSEADLYDDLFDGELAAAG